MSPSPEPVCYSDIFHFHTFFYYSVSFYPIPLWMAARLPDVPPPVSNVQNVVFPHPCLCCPPSPTTFLWLDATFDWISRLCSLDPTVSAPLFFLFRCGFKCVTLEWNAPQQERISLLLSLWTHYLLIFLQTFFLRNKKLLLTFLKLEWLVVLMPCLIFPLSRASHTLWPHDVWAPAEMGAQKAGGEVLPTPRRLAHWKQRSGWEHSHLTGHVSPTTAPLSLADSGWMFFIPFSMASNMWKKETSTSWPNNAGFCSWFSSVVLFTKWMISK